MFYICFDQMQNNLISQSAQMERGDTPNDMLPAMNQIGCILFVPLIHYVINPLLHRRHIYPKPVTRIAIGFVFVSLSMAYAAVVQSVIYSASPCYEHPRACSSVADREPNHVNVWIQAPVFFLIAMGEAWAFVTALEVAYSHAPEHMKVVIQAVFPLMAGIGSACAMGLTAVTYDPNFIIFYASLAGGMATTTIVFWLVFRKYDGRQDRDKTQEPTESDLTPPSVGGIGSNQIRRTSHMDIELGPTATRVPQQSATQSDITFTDTRPVEFESGNTRKKQMDYSWQVEPTSGT